MAKRARESKRQRAVGGGKGRGTKKTAARTRRAAPKRRIIEMATRWRKGSRGVGLGAAVCVVEAVGGRIEVASGSVEQMSDGRGATRGADALMAGIARKLGRGGNWDAVSDALSAAGHGQRLRIMAYLLEGPATYRALQNATGLAVGPLYHHIDRLRLAGLMEPKQRDLYTLTRAGRNLVLLARVAGPLLKDRRPRAQPGT